MKNLRLVFEDDNMGRKDISLPMEKWISDWLFECNIVPSNDAVVLVAELDGKPILNDINTVNGGHVQFIGVAKHFRWTD